MSQTQQSGDTGELASIELSTKTQFPVLELDLLGSPEVRLDRHPLAFRTKKALALLIYLAVMGTSQPREHLAALLWPDSEEASARATLRSTARFVRHALAGMSATALPENFLFSGIDRMGRKSLWLQLVNSDSAVILDIHRLDQALALAHQGTTTPDRSKEATQLAHLAEAVRLCNGPFLEGFTLDDAPIFEDWIVQQRSFWQGRMDQAFASLCALQLQGGAFAATIDVAERWLHINPLQEAAYCTLMEAQAAVGDRNAALVTYEHCRQTLTQVLGIEPSPETVALAERLRAPQLSATRASEGHQHLRRAPMIGALPGQIWHTLETPLVGREHEFAALVVAYERAQREGVQVVMLEGEAGIGKTRLAREFLHWVGEARGAEILHGRAFETGGRLPYQPLTEAFRSRLERERAPEDLLDDVWLAELSRVLPDLRERYPDLVVTGVSEDIGAQGRLYEAMAQLGLALLQRSAKTASGTLVLFLDDLQWSDVGTRDLLRFLMRRWQETSARVLILLAVRREEIQTSDDLREWLRGLTQEVDETAITRQSLAALDADKLKALVDQLFADEFADFADAGQVKSLLVSLLYQETSGLPLYFVQTLRALLDQGILAWEDELVQGGSQPRLLLRTRDVSRLRGVLPATLRAVILGRLDRLSIAARHVLAAGAVLGTRFHPEQAWTLADLDEKTGIDALEEAERHMVIRTLPGGSICEFSHDKIQNVIYEEAGKVRRKVLHRKVLEMLEHDSTATAAELAHHALAASLDVAAFRYSLEAGDVAMKVFAVRDAIIHYEHAMSLLSQATENGKDDSDPGMTMTALPGEAWEHLHTQLGRAYEWHCAWDEARAIYEAQRAYAREHGARTLEVSTLTRMAHVAREQSWDLPMAQNLVNEALAMVEPTDDKGTLAETHWTLAQFAALAGEHGVALPHVECALELARAVNRQELIARSLLLIGQIAMQRGAWGEAARAVAEGRQCFANLVGEAAQIERKAALKLKIKEAVTAESSAQLLFTGSLPSTTAAYRAMEAICLATEAIIAINHGMPHAGIVAGKDAMQLLQNAPNTHIGGLVLHPLSVGFVEVGQFERALSIAQQGVAAARVGGDPYALLNTIVALAHAWHALGQHEEAQASLREATAAIERIPAPYWHITALSFQCANLAAMGDWSGAYALAIQVERLREFAHSRLASFDFVRYYEMEALLKHGDVTRAHTALERLSAQLTPDSRERRHWLVYLRMQALLAQHEGDKAGAIAALNQALQLAEEIGLLGEQWQIHAMLAALNQRETQEGMAHIQAAVSIVHELAQLIQEKTLRDRYHLTALRTLSGNG